MKSLFLLRHAKSDRSAAHAGDHERPLNRRGRSAARRIGVYLARIRQAPELILSSSAVRARTTAELAAEAGGWSCPLRDSRALYLDSADAVLGQIVEQDDRLERLLVVGHEPTWSELASRLIGGGRIEVPTAALLRIDFEAKRWSDVGFGEGGLVWLVTPRLLARLELDRKDDERG
ncbi:MAG: histidine phosphatase family protein [Myxococcales bacterium]|nr:histidine phosphatase family protein [Myxococcales bacterium]